MQVDILLNDAIRLSQVHEAVAIISETVTTAAGDLKAVSAQVVAVSDNVASSSMAIADVSEEVTTISAQAVTIHENVLGVQSNVERLKEAVEEVVDTGLLAGIPRAKLASYRSGRANPPNSCFEGTRTQMLSDLVTWIDDKDLKSPRIYCLNGIAGIGKTTIARTIAEHAAGEGILGGDFFFSRSGEAELRNPQLVFPTMAYQLSRFDKKIARHVTTALAEDPDIPSGQLRDQLQKLVIDPLCRLRPAPTRTIIFVLDAMDECDAKGGKEILQSIINTITTVPFLFNIRKNSAPKRRKALKSIRTCLIRNRDLS